MSDTRIIRIEKHHFHHHERPPAEIVHVPRVETRTKYVDKPCERSHLGPVTTTLAVVGGIWLLATLFSSGD